MLVAVVLVGLVWCNRVSIIEQAQKEHEKQNDPLAIHLLERLLKTLDPHAQEQYPARALLASIYSTQNQFSHAISLYTTLLQWQEHNAMVHVQLGRLEMQRSQVVLAIHHFERACALNGTIEHLVLHPLALAYHILGNLDLAAKTYQKALVFHEPSAQLYYDYAVTLQHQGFIIEANTHYNKAVELQQDFPSAWLNIAALHHKHGSIEMAIPNYQRALSCTMVSKDIELMAKTNLACALEQMGVLEQALLDFQQALQLVPLVYRENTTEFIDMDLLVRSHLRRARESICDWMDFENNLDQLIHLATTHQLYANGTCTLLPFDTLTMPKLSPQLQKLVAERYSSQWDNQKQISFPMDPLQNATNLHVGYLSFDFSDHPTAHLMEGLFHYHHQVEFTISAFSFGKENNSSYREAIMKQCDHFHRLTQLGHQQIAELIAESRVHILIDAQGHTKGSRQQIVAFHPAPIVVNYLVYAGTMGASFVDYFVVDRYLLPLEATTQYVSEKLVVMPNSYQVNYYPLRNSPNRPLRRETYGLPEDVVVFANFNKREKLEPNVFGVWMSILRQVPGSVLWLLRPTKTNSFELYKTNLEREARQHGILPERIIYAIRVPKKEHLERQALADLFLDTFVVMSFWYKFNASSRVGYSLMANLGLETWLVTYSKKEFVQVAVFYTQHKDALQALQLELHQLPTAKLFQTEKYTRHLERAYFAMWELHQFTIPHHLILIE